jgi:NADH pyrophosphatase NudC (nudix superfamily)
VEEGETPEEAIIREVKEELDLNLREHRFFRRTEFPDRVEYTFWCRLNKPTTNITLNEGQELRWFTPSEARRLDLAFGFNQLLAEFS